MPTVLGGRLALLAALALMGCALSTGAGSRPPSPPGPSANDAAPPGGDVAAYVSGGKLYLLSGGASRAVSVSGLPSGPRWSHDGAWVAYLLAPAPSGPGSGSQEVHLVRADGSGDHALPFVGTDFAWSPAADLLAFTTGGGAALALSAPDGGPTELVTAGPGTIDSFAWSPDGAALAYSVRPSSSLSASDQLFSVSSDGGRFQRWAYAPPGNTGLILAGWWPDGKGLLFWTDPGHSASIAADGLPLVSLPKSGGPGVMLTDSRPYRPWLAWSPDGASLLVVTGGDREPWDGKTLTLCRPLTWSCRALPQPPGTVSLDPAWSRDGTQIAFVRAPARGTPGAGGDLVSWYPSRRLWVADGTGVGAREVAGAGEGVSAPSWSTGGSSVRYSTATAIRSIPAAGGTPEPLAGSLTGGDDAEWAVAGKRPWTGVAAWAPAP